MDENLDRLRPLITAETARAATAASCGEEVDCVAVFATNEQWRAVRVLAADVAARAAYLGYASDRFEAWQVSAQRRAMGPWPPGWRQCPPASLHHPTRRGCRHDNGRAVGRRAQRQARGGPGLAHVLSCVETRLRSDAHRDLCRWLGLD